MGDQCAIIVSKTHFCIYVCSIEGASGLVFKPPDLEVSVTQWHPSATCHVCTQLVFYIVIWVMHFA